MAIALLPTLALAHNQLTFRGLFLGELTIYISMKIKIVVLFFLLHPAIANHLKQVELHNVFLVHQLSPANVL